MNDEIIFRKLETRKRGKTDFAKLEKLSDESLEKAIAKDKDAAPLLTDEWFRSAKVVRPGKTPVTLRIDDDVIEYFRKNGRFYQTKINLILRKYMEMETFKDLSD